MKLKATLSSVVVLTIAAASLAGCSSNQAESKKSVNDPVIFTSKDNIPTQDSAVATDIISGQSLVNTMDGLYRYDGKVLKPAMATSIVQPTNNGLTYTFKLRPHVQWSNGDPVTAQDFVFAWRRAVDPKTKSQYAFIFEGINNAKAISEGKKPTDTLGVKALNAQTLEVNLEKPIPYFNKLMAFQTFYPQNPKVVNKWGKKYGTSAKTLVFNGPYKLQNWNPSANSWTQVKNDKYWNAKQVQVKKLKYQVVKDASTALNLYQSGKVDRAELTGDTSKQMKGSKGYSVLKQNSTIYLELNQKKVELLKNQKIRQALSLAINRSQLTKKVVGNGTSTASSVTAANMSFDPQKPKQDFVAETSHSGLAHTKYDVAQAKKLWQAGLAETGNTHKKFTLTLLNDDTDIAKQQSEFLQNQLQKLPNLKISLNNVPYKNRLSRSVSGDFDLVVTTWNADFPDPINFLTLFTSDASYNSGKWANAQYDDFVNKSLNADATNEVARWQDMKAAQNIINEQQGVVPLYQNGQAFMTHKRITKLDYGPGNMYNMVNLRIKTK
ncbi:MAG: peptide ABC transporter substrate-binding protein [Bombilactobacillus mellifer]|uniref:peptide ABC transporter substrate-binding protein n=1 Tax=Bombilactobacillus mellifer TaxID=1218492 RepID=UPI0023F223C9|nr:peptide ABC transporter substrate-binding protein [Bombilactobacillus mellifer]MCT6826417.1 peptide ABC transporter substrate-binding protein [Bombilactobacillus mellifer]MCT6844583.1 peptide ABC transporter substrate-binding protein [Bombilactobacillus mellifer]MCT6894116.1 peptide ABC transporter substrate-binding protein [Bombilactobacillus mellifer]